MNAETLLNYEGWCGEYRAIRFQLERITYFDGEKASWALTLRVPTEQIPQAYRDALIVHPDALQQGEAIVQAGPWNTPRQSAYGYALILNSASPEPIVEVSYVWIKCLGDDMKLEAGAEFVTAIIDQLCEKFPDLHVNCGAYGGWLPPSECTQVDEGYWISKEAWEAARGEF